jgi:uncharacterized damage-inducible protein DinB
MDATAQPFLDFSTRKLALLHTRIEWCLSQLTDEQVWARGGENENAVGNLVLHLSGNVRQWIIAGVGQTPDLRDRAAEFEARSGPSVEELRGRLRATVEEACAVIGRLEPGRLTQQLTIQNYPVLALEAIYHVVEHFSMHAGQIIFITKMLTGADPGFYAFLRTSAAHSSKTP